MLCSAAMSSRAAITSCASSKTSMRTSTKSKRPGRSILRRAGAPVPTKARLQVLSGPFPGRELELTKALTTLGRPGVQVAAITRRSEGYFIVHVDSGKENDYPQVHGVPIGPQARRLNDNDVVQLAGVKMGFFES